MPPARAIFPITIRRLANRSWPQSVVIGIGCARKTASGSSRAARFFSTADPLGHRQRPLQKAGEVVMKTRFAFIGIILAATVISIGFRPSNTSADDLAPQVAT